MNGFDVWTSVKVTKAKHPRLGQAGTVFATNPERPDEVAVKFDSDSTVVVVAIADLERL